MLLKNGLPFKDNGFRDDAGTAYPAGYAAQHPEQWAELKITEVIPDPQPNPRWYTSSLDWATGKWSSSPKDLDGIKTGLVRDAKQTAYNLLSRSDWRIIKEAETEEPCPEAYLDYRELVRTRCNDIEEAITEATDLDGLKSVDTASWPKPPEEEAEEQPDDNA
tara:strand:- start:13627 stop:14115 length:489 start_codon:yes stop_codon:yes gene_type:complete